MLKICHLFGKQEKKIINTLNLSNPKPFVIRFPELSDVDFCAHLTIFFMFVHCVIEHNDFLLPVHIGFTKHITKIQSMVVYDHHISFYVKGTVI